MTGTTWPQLRHRQPTGQSASSAAIGSVAAQAGQSRKPIVSLRDNIDRITSAEEANAGALSGRESLVEQERTRHRTQNDAMSLPATFNAAFR